MLYLHYNAGDGVVYTDQEARPAPGGETAGGRCLLPVARCREVRTPKGRTVLIDARGVHASPVLGGTLVSVMAVDVDRDAVLALIDSLQPVDAAEIEFSRA